MVVLDADAAALGEVPLGELRREVPGMEIVGDVRRLDVQQTPQVREVRLEGSVRCQLLEVSGVRRDVGAAAAGQRKGVLELGADCQQRFRSRDRQGQWLRCVTTGTPDQAFAPINYPGDRVVIACPNLAVVGQERVGDPRQPLQRLAVVGRERLIRQVAAGEDDGPPESLEKQVVERRVRQE